MLIPSSQINKDKFFFHNVFFVPEIDARTPYRSNLGVKNSRSTTKLHVAWRGSTARRVPIRFVGQAITFHSIALHRMLTGLNLLRLA